MDSNTDAKNATQNFGSLGGEHSTSEKIELRPGIKLKQRYLIEKELGRGGIGVVYLARDERLHSMPVVIKFLLEDNHQNSWLQKKFFQEAEALARLNHPGIVRVVDRDQSEDGKPFFVMEFVNGEPLRSVMKPEGMDFEYVAHLMRQIGQALDAAHREGICHRDLKPENIMLQVLNNGDEQIKLIDFGIAKLKNSQSGATTEVPIVAGSLNYIAPEQLLSQAVSAATDIYSLGIIAYEMVTGRRPFQPDAPNTIAALQQLIGMQQREDIIPPKRLRPSLAEAAQEVILKALSFQAGNRPQDARAFAEELADALGDIPHGARLATLQSTVIDSQQTLRQPTLPVTPAATEIVARQPTAQVHGQATRQQTAAINHGRANRKSGLWLVLALFVVAAIVVAIVFGKKILSPAGSPQTPAATAPGSTTAEPERVLTYSVTVQQDPRLYPGKRPFQLAGEMSFSAGDRVRFTFASPQAGSLYIINESPELGGGKTIFNLLFPSTSSNNGSAQLNADQQVQIPERGDGFIFDAEEGTERLWLVWSAQTVGDLEALKKWANPQDRGEIKDTAQANLLRDFLLNHSASKPAVEKDEVKKQTTVKGNGDLLVKLINLEHH
jgi:serine/threonine protein kinase